MPPRRLFTALVAVLLGAAMTSDADAKPAAPSSGGSSEGGLRAASLFTDHAVLQRGAPIPVWGWTTAGHTVIVTLDKATATATAGAQGRWSVRLPAHDAGGPFTLAITDGKTLEFNDVMIGEVWLCSGQSNMALPLHRTDNGAAVADAAHDDGLRLFTVRRHPASSPQTHCGGAWTPCSPRAAAQFSAVAYSFGVELRRTLKVPVGLIGSYVGGTPVEAWTPADAQVPVTYTKEDRAPKLKSELYNGMIAPLVGFNLRGAIWYQGENNARNSPHFYAPMLTSMIRAWRARWNQPELPFYFVQLPNWAPGRYWPLVRQAMLHVYRTVPHTGMAVTIDIGEAKNLHPTNKHGVGRRLSLWALHDVYGQDVVCSGPIYRTAHRDGGKMVVEFDTFGSPLAVRGGGTLTGFQIAGADGNFTDAQATIVGQTIEAHSPQVPAPVAVRYAWAANPACNLVNGKGLPASPFSSNEPAPAKLH